MKNLKKLLLIVILFVFASSVTYTQNQEVNANEFKEYELELKKIETNFDTIGEFIKKLKDLEFINTDINIKTTLEKIENNLNNLQSNIKNSRTIIFKNNSDMSQTITEKFKIEENKLKNIISDLKIAFKKAEEGKTKEIAVLLSNKITQYSDLIKIIAEKNIKIKSSSKKFEALKTQIKVEKDNNKDLVNELKNKDKIIDYLDGGNLNFGISIGFNGIFYGREITYIVGADSKAREILSSGLKGIVSAVAVWQLKNIDIILNVPLIEIGIGNSDANQTSSIFNKPIDVGLGLGIRLTSKLSFCGIINVSTSTIIDEISLKEIEFTEVPYSTIDLSKYPTTTKPSISITFGLLIKFGKGNK